LILLLVFASAANALEGGFEDLRQTGKAFASIARAVSPSVVFIQVEGKASPTTIRGFS
jgi:serine protease Do